MRKVGAVEELRRFVGAAVERLVLKESVILATVSEALILRQIHIHGERVLALALRVRGIEKPVLGAEGYRQIRGRKRLENSKAIGTGERSAGDRFHAGDYVARKTSVRALGAGI